MKWSRPIDYHGSRSYEQDERAATPFGLTAFAKWLKQKFRKAPSRPPPSTLLLRNGEQHFSLLGAISGNPPKRVAECPFPTNSRMKDNGGSASYLRHED
jgi:hypothetical protein